MAIYHSLDEYKKTENGVCAALGYFDGVHLGHRAVIGACKTNGGGLPCVVLTFSENPALSLGRPCPPLLTDNARKAELLQESGADDVIFSDFSAIRDKSPADFVRDILRDRLNAKEVFCGFNYRFGRGGEGDTEVLHKLCAAHGIGVTVLDPVYLENEPVSSSRIRALLSDGEIGQVNDMLGCPYRISGSIEGGNHLGTVMGFPTVNLPLNADAAIPRRGVYASRLTIDGKPYLGATDIGVHPTVGEAARPLCETFLLDFGGGDLYGKTAVCELLEFIRPEMRFPSPEALTEQIRRDCEKISATAQQTIK